MGRPPGRDQFEPLMRLVAILTMLSSAEPGWVRRDEVIAEIGYSSASMAGRRDELRRDLRHLRELGWAIEVDAGDGGADSRMRLRGPDPRLATLLTDGEIAQLARAVAAAGMDPRALGLSAPTTAIPPLHVSLRDTHAARLEMVLHALAHRCMVYARYRDCDRELQVDRVRQTGSGRWLVVARDQGAQKQFRLDRFQDMRVGAPGTAGEPQPDTTDPDPLTISDGRPVTAVVLTAADEEDRVVRELGEPAEREALDGEVRLTIPVVNRRLWRMRLYQLGTRVTLQGPQDLCDEVRAELLSFAGAHR